MPDYGKKTVVELQEILKGRSLPHSGKKAELVARLNEADKSDATETSPQAVPAGPGPDAAQAVPADKPEAAPAPAPAPEPAAQEPSAPTNAHDATPLAPSKPEQTDRENSVNTDSNLATAADYSMGLGQSSYDDELKKRRARAERFGVPPEELDAEALRVADRAKRFGAASTAVGKLDEALPIESARRAKRGREGGNPLDDPGLRLGRGNKRRLLGRGGRGDVRRGEKPTGVQKPVGKPTTVFSNEKDRLAAEARTKKFATA